MALNGSACWETWPAHSSCKSVLCNELEPELETASVVDRKRCSRSSLVVQHKRRQVCVFETVVGSPRKRNCRGVKQQ